MRIHLSLALAALTLAAGCLQADDTGQAPPSPLPEVDGAGAILHANVAANIGSPVEMEHDHTDLLLHARGHNLAFVAWSRLDVELGANGFANFVLHDTPDGRTLAFVAVDGDERGGFTIADVTDPGAIAVLGSYRAPGSGFQEVRVTPDGRHAILNVQELPALGNDAQPGAGACSVCLHVVDITDLSAPELESVFPIEAMGTHNMDVVTDATGTYVVHVGQPVSSNNDPVGNRLGVLRLVETPEGAVLVPWSAFAHPAILDDGRSFPHDVVVQQHPGGRRVAYVSHWDGGVATFDATSLLAITPLGVNTERAPSSALAIHWTMQEPQARADGRVIAWSAPEIGSLDDGTGVIRAYDATDPADLRQVGAWELPGDISISGAGGRYILSPHTAIPDLGTGLLAVAHYHAGVWVLDISDPAQPRAVAYFMPHGDPAGPYTGDLWWKKPNFDPDGYGPNVYMARWHDGLLWVTERGTGLYALRYTGPVPGPVV